MRVLSPEIEFALECRTELRKVLVPFDSIHPLFGLQQAESEPSGSLLGVVPPLDVADVFFHKAIQVLDRIGRLEAPTHLLKDAKPMEREGLFETFLQGTSRRPVDLLKLGVELFQGRPGLLVGRLLVSTSQLPTPFFAIALWQVSDDVFPLVPLAALNQGIA